MAVEKWVVVAEFGDGSDFRYEPRYLFEGSEGEAIALMLRLNRAANSTYVLAQLADNRRGPGHAEVLAAARKALTYLDAAASDDNRYRVHRVTPFSLTEEGEPETPAEQPFRDLRDLV